MGFLILFLRGAEVDKENITWLSNKVWITRKCRVIAATRLERTNLYWQVLIYYYSLVLLAFSVWTVLPNKSNLYTSFISVISSIVIFSSSLFLNSFNFRDKAQMFKLCYIKLDKINCKLDLLKDHENINSELAIEFEALHTAYLEVLSNTDNHSEYDYFRLLLDLNKDKNKLPLKDKIKYYSYMLLLFAITLMLYLMPVITFILMSRGAK